MTSIVLALFFVALAAGFSWLKEYRIEKDLTVASLRTIAQVLALGLILNWIFQHSSLGIVLLAALVMSINAAFNSAARVKHKRQRLILDNFLAITITIWPISYLGTVLLNEEVWWKPDVFLPLIGMLLGNSLNGLSIGINQFSQDLRDKKEEILSLLAMGGTVNEVTLGLFQRSIHLALTPTLNSMISMGIVSIPGMMTGQILAGASATAAAQTQIVLMLLIASTSFFGAWVGLTLSKKHLFNSKGQVCF